ncbi:pseudouridine synthase [Rhodobacter viridis]|uniref:Pseudouridine synthase n=1 Tax=Rhodobacter viridis TaxID=1054202 RepID=A0A318U1Y8_9RHOB|nr:pseudouridine synthase [Rhodobacter viridis]PYF10311.1 pseudouridine synthase [Rhodobacter viridis]
MTNTNETPAPTLTADTAERIAKVIARSGVASRRDAEKMILAGRVTVNGKKVETPALDVKPSDKVVIDGKPIDAPQETRLWLYYKPLGLVTTEKDDQGRRTIFDEMPEEMPRVLNVGRLDLNSEGLLLLTNDGGLKRRLELPETGWLRKYRVRVNGRPTTETFDPLRRGITIDGEDFQPMEVSLDRQQGANAWLTVGIREGKNREIRRAMGEVGMTVNRLIRVSYGPFRLNDMEPGAVVEVKRKMLRDQLGDRLLSGIEDGKPPRSERMAPKPGARRPRPEGGEGDERKGFGRQRDFAGAEGDRKPKSFGMKSHREDGERKPFERREDGERKPFARREDGDRKPYARREDGDRKPYAPRDGEKKPYARREDGDRKPYAPRDGEKKPYARREDGDRKPYAPRDGEKKPYARREDGDRKPYAPRDGEKKPYARREDGDRKPYAPRDGEKKPYARREDGDRKPYAPRDGEKKPYARREDGDRKPYAPRDGEKKPYARREDGDRKPYAPRDGEGGKSFGPRGGKPGFKSEGFKSHGGGKPGSKPRSEGFKSHASGDKRPFGGKPGPKRG